MTFRAESPSAHEVASLSQFSCKAYEVSIKMAYRKKADPSNTLTPREQIDLFMARGEEMWNSRVRREGLKVAFGLKGNLNKEFVGHYIEEPDAEDFRSFLTIFRKFISEDSPIHLPKIYSICHQHIADERFKDVLAEARRIWLDMEKKHASRMIVSIGGRELMPKDITNIWINGHYFHDDVEGMRLLKTMTPMQVDATKAIFIDYTIKTVEIIRHLAQNIRAATGNGSLKL